MTRRTIYRLLACCGALLLVACAQTGSYDRLKAKAPEAGDFSTSLAAEYLAYAESQLEQGHYYDADYFAAKGLGALEHYLVEPEFGPENSPEFNQNRQLLLSLLTVGVRRSAPETAARAQLLYDCWVHQKKQMTELDDVPCASEFEAAIEELEAVAAAFKPTKKRKFQFQFTSINTKLTQKMKLQLDQVAATAHSLPAYQVVLHAVPYGFGGRYQDVVEGRLYALRAGLMERGVPPDKIVIQNGLEGKTVYLSHDQKEKPKNSVLLRIKTTGFAVEEHR